MSETLEKIERLTIEPGRSAVFIERHLAARTEIIVGAGAHVTHYRLHQEINHELNVRVEAGASYEAVTLHRGNGDLKVAFDLAGEEASCRFDIAYVLSGDQRALIRTDVRHNADKTASRQLVKGAVGGEAAAAFEGAILIPYGKKAIDGAQQHRALLLSPKAEVKAVPLLEIYADDVKCAHGSAIGTLNQQQLFYMRSRGIDEALARELLTTAFLNEVFDSVGDETIREEFKKLAAEGLKHGD